MAKLGRYSANRIKHENLTAAKTVEVSDCGTMFTLDSATEFAVTLPSVSSSGPGWWAEFHILGAPASANYTVVTNSENVLMGKVFSTHTVVDGNASVGNHVVEANTVTFVDALAVPGDYVKIQCNGTHYIATAFASASTGITITAE